METLVPLIPKEAERKHSLAQQYLKSARYLATANLQRDRGRDVQEVNAVRAIPLIDLDPKRIIPERYFPRDGNPEFIFLQKSLLAANPHSIRQFDSNQYLGNPFQSFFNVLSQMAATGASVESIMDALWRNSDADLIGTEHSTSDSEDDALRDFLNAALMNMGELPSLAARREAVLDCLVSVELPWQLHHDESTEVDHGSIGVYFCHNISGSRKSFRAPVVSLECTSRSIGGINGNSEKPIAFAPPIFAQEVAEMIGGVITQLYKLILRHGDQETFVISIDGPFLYISTAYVSREYVRYTETARYSEADAGKICLWVRRVQALESLWALVSYIASGNAKVNIVTAAKEIFGGPS
ncbi:uncharacterized protein BDW43DRAFT_320232 [Aspergillus alliaceus]|uniref:uncharacterized protein n=1 Tax=Petromyces alliaceus TaxID=209559 RepID=UPI0012A74357|nr:uncharacterized protein BDW43DRAFT_320232 [Aspergillus alliaceus]KAB8232294.1 hypothetical protein BDW43DRAFT_320232 [Aspergillus alliaceus]